ncbi:hypothetical protein R0I01_00565 [Bacillus pumilus]|nr:hypothetical protein R0I01_00565 [Bacillus pumilus]
MTPFQALLQFQKNLLLQQRKVHASTDEQVQALRKNENLDTEMLRIKPGITSGG